MPDFQYLKSAIDFNLQYKGSYYHNDYEAFLSSVPSVTDNLMCPTVFYHICSFHIEK